jgi:hypothetical protein
MQPVEIIKDLFFIERGFLNGNHFVFRSEKPILIDTAYIADFKETVDQYFNAEYRPIYDAIMNDFQKRGIVKTQNGHMSTTIKS